MPPWSVQTCAGAVPGRGPGPRDPRAGSDAAEARDPAGDDAAAVAAAVAAARAVAAGEVPRREALEEAADAAAARAPDLDAPALRAGGFGDEDEALGDLDGEERAVEGELRQPARRRADDDARVEWPAPSGPRRLASRATRRGTRSGPVEA